MSLSTMRGSEASTSSTFPALSSGPVFTLRPLALGIPYTSREVQVKGPPAIFLSPDGQYVPYASSHRPLSNTDKLLLIPSPVPSYTYCAIPYDKADEFNPDHLLERGAYFFQAHRVPDDHDYYLHEQEEVGLKMRDFLMKEAHDRIHWGEVKHFLKKPMPEEEIRGERLENDQIGNPRYARLDMTRTEHWRNELGWAGSEDETKKQRDRRYFTVTHERYHIQFYPHFWDWSHDDGSWVEREPGGDSTGPRYKRQRSGVIDILRDIEMMRRDFREAAVTQAKVQEAENRKTSTARGGSAGETTVTDDTNKLKRKRASDNEVPDSKVEGKPAATNSRPSKRQILAGARDKPQRAVPEEAHRVHPKGPLTTKASTNKRTANNSLGKNQKGKVGTKAKTNVINEQQQYPLIDEAIRERNRWRQAMQLAREIVHSNEKDTEKVSALYVPEFIEIVGLEKVEKFCTFAGFKAAFTLFQTKQAEGAGEAANAAGSEKLSNHATTSARVQPAVAPTTTVATANAPDRATLKPKVFRQKAKLRSNKSFHIAENPTTPVSPSPSRATAELDATSPEKENWAPYEEGLGRLEGGSGPSTGSVLAPLNDFGPHRRVGPTNGKRKRTEGPSLTTLVQEGDEQNGPQPKMRKVVLSFEGNVLNSGVINVSQIGSSTSSFEPVDRASRAAVAEMADFLTSTKIGKPATSKPRCSKRAMLPAPKMVEQKAGVAGLR